MSSRHTARRRSVVAVARCARSCYTYSSRAEVVPHHTHAHRTDKEGRHDEEHAPDERILYQNQPHNDRKWNQQRFIAREQLVTIGTSPTGSCAKAPCGRATPAWSSNSMTMSTQFFIMHAFLRFVVTKDPSRAALRSWGRPWGRSPRACPSGSPPPRSSGSCPPSRGSRGSHRPYRV